MEALGQAVVAVTRTPLDGVVLTCDACRQSAIRSMSSGAMAGDWQLRRHPLSFLVMMTSYVSTNTTARLLLASLIAAAAACGGEPDAQALARDDSTAGATASADG